MEINKNIFREYDIRGVAGVHFEPHIVAEYERFYGAFPGVTINLETSKAIGMAYGTRIKRGGGSQVIVGYEERPYAKELHDAFVDGILETGVSVACAGTATTPFIYFLTSYKNFDGGVNITGSHNIYFFNGFKMMKKGTSPLYGEELKLLYKMIFDEDFDVSETKGVRSSYSDAYAIYCEYVKSHIQLKRKLRVAVDCGNGSAGPYIVDFLESLGCEVVGKLYLLPDAYFPNHVPDPEIPHYVKDLCEEVKKTGADIGIALDADADRVGFITEKGEFVFSDDIFLLLAKDVLSRNPGKKILCDVKSSQVIMDLVPTFGGIPLLHRTGHAPIKDTMRKDMDIVLAGEAAHHLYFVEDYFRIDDGFFAAARILQLLAASSLPFSEMLAEFPKRVRVPEIKLPCLDELKVDVVSRIREVLAKQYETITIDGVRVVFDAESWALVRPSNTSPFLTIKLEAPNEKRFLEIKNVFADEFAKYPEIRDTLDRENICSRTGILGYR